jgi:hypothetical protein
VIVPTTRRVLLLAAILAIGSPEPATGQARTGTFQMSAPAPRGGSWEVGGGIVYVGGVDFGEVRATLTGNTGRGPFDQFTTDTRLQPAVGLQGRVGYYFSPTVSIEGGVRFSKPTLRVEITGDTEGGPDTVAEEDLSSYVFDGSLLLHFTGLAFGGGRAIPFVSGGAGYIRDLHEQDELVETGTEYHAGGGIKIWFGDGRRRFGLRGEAGVSIRDGGFDLGDGTRTVPIAGASMIYLF